MLKILSLIKIALVFPVFVFFLQVHSSEITSVAPEEAVKHFAQALRAGDFDSLSQMCSPSVRPNAVRQLKENQEVIKKYLLSPVFRTEKFKSYTLFFFRPEGELSGEMILVFNREGLLAVNPLISSTPLPRLSEAEMYEDFDFLTRKLEDIFPLDTVNRQVFGLDFRQVLRTYRGRIKEGMSIAEFTALVADALNDCKGSHLWLADIHSLVEWYPAVKEVVQEMTAPTVEPGAVELTHTMLTIFNLGNSPGKLSLRYFDGAYYNWWPLVLEGKEYQAGMKLTAINGEDIASVSRRLQPHLSAYDVNRELFLGQSFTLIQHDIYLLCPNAEELTFRTKDSEAVTVHLSKFRDDMQKRPACTPPEIKKIVLYLKESQILYVRIPQMLISDTDFYLEEIKKQGKDRKIRAVVLDVRYNSGGSDLVWMDILRVLIGREHTYVTQTAYTDSESVRSYLKHHGEIIRKFYPDASDGLPPEPKEIKVPFLENRTFLVTTDSDRLTPRADSLRLECPIYVITHDIYSSTGGLVSVAAQFDFMTSVGLPAVDLQGKGVDPVFYSLPHSKLIFSCSPDIDLANCQNARDVLHLGVEHEVKFTAEEYFNYWNTTVPDDPSEYLIRKDPFFRQVLEMVGKTEL